MVQTNQNAKNDQQDKKAEEDAQPVEEYPPDNRGPRPTDPNALPKWIVEQTGAMAMKPTLATQALPIHRLSV